MKILIKLVNDPKPLILDNIGVIAEYVPEDKSIGINFFSDEGTPESLETVFVSNKDLEYFRKVGD